MSLCASCYSIVGRASLFPLIQLVLISWLPLNVEAYAFSHCMETSSSATAWYDATSFDVGANMWLDKTDNGAHASVTGTMSSAVLFANEQPAVVGDENTAVTFPTYVNGQHTVINLCKYNGDTKGRIGQSSIATAWFGHSGGQSGVAFEGEWLTPQRDMFGDEWVLSVQQSGLYRANGFDLTLAVDIARTVPMGRLQINDGFMNDEGSDFACAEVIIFNDQILSRDEMGCVEDYLNEKYALGLARYVKPSIPFESCLVDGHSVSAWYDAGSYLPAFGVWNDRSLNNWNGNAFPDGALRYFDGTDVSNALYRNHQPAVYGNWSTYVDFPLSIGDEYTVVSLSKYNGARQRLILQSLESCSWPPAVFGHYGTASGGPSGASGVAHNDGSWITTTSDKFGSNWVLGVQTATTYRGNRLNLTAKVVSTQPVLGQLAINRGKCAMHYNPQSDFAFAQLVVFNGQTLNEDEQVCIEEVFNTQYSLGLVAQPTTPWPTVSPTVTTTVAEEDNAYTHTKSKTLWYLVGAFCLFWCCVFAAVNHKLRRQQKESDADALNISAVNHEHQPSQSQQQPGQREPGLQPPQANDAATSLQVQPRMARVQSQDADNDNDEKKGDDDELEAEGQGRQTGRQSFVYDAEREGARVTAGSPSNSHFHQDAIDATVSKTCDL